jgi:predicted ATPase
MMRNLPNILTGGPGTGKSTVLGLLESYGCICLPESAREIIQSRTAQGLPPRQDPQSFAKAILKKDIERYRAIPQTDQPVFIDRGVADALCMLAAVGGADSVGAMAMLERYPVSVHVFFFRPWEAIYLNDAERDQTFDECRQVSSRLESWYRSLGFELVDVPQLKPQARADFILRHARAAQQSHAAGGPRR